MERQTTLGDRAQRAPEKADRRFAPRFAPAPRRWASR